MPLYTGKNNPISQAIREKNIEKLGQAVTTLDPNQGIDFQYPFFEDIKSTPLGDAIFNAWMEGVEFFLEMGASTETVVCNNQTGYQDSARQLAELMQEEEIVNLLEAHELSLTSINLNEAQSVNCDCCYGEIEADEVKVSCTGDTHHSYCKGCIEGMFNNTNFQNEEASFVCFGTEECKADFKATELTEALGQDRMDFLTNKQILNALPREIRDRIESCPKCGDQAEVPENHGPIYKCINEACGAESCRECGSQPHPNKSCKAAGKQCISYQERIENAMSEAANPRRCANEECKIRIEKIRGCNKVVCPLCKHITCFVCGADITDKGYQHFKDTMDPNDTRTCGTYDRVSIKANPQDILEAKHLEIQRILEEDPSTDRETLEKVGKEHEEAPQLMTLEACLKEYDRIRDEYSLLYSQAELVYNSMSLNPDPARRAIAYATYTTTFRDIREEEDRRFATLENDYRRQAAYYNNAPVKGGLKYMSLMTYVDRRTEIMRRLDRDLDEVLQQYRENRVLWRPGRLEDTQERLERRCRHEVGNLDKRFQAQAAHFAVAPQQFDHPAPERAYRP